ncbi:Mth938-like domain-containing protein [Thiomonas bhubaneswarensis]|nr:Mth938-like domain-containing protein [Thiomonas bhubaneswarensis]
MKLQPDFAPDTQMVSAYGPGYVEVNGVRHTQACVFAPQQAPKPWGVDRITSLQTSHIDALLLDPLPEVVLIGTGQRQHMLAPALMRQLMARRIGWEVMDTAAACRTYNILAGEGRQVLAALMIE